MGFLLVLTCVGSTWSRGLQLTTKQTGYNKGTWELANPNLVPWGLLALDFKGTYIMYPATKQMELYCHDSRDSAGVNTLCFVLFDAPTNKWDKKATGSDGMIYYPKNPAGNDCDLNWAKMC